MLESAGLFVYRQMENKFRKEYKTLRNLWNNLENGINDAKRLNIRVVTASFNKHFILGKICFLFVTQRSSNNTLYIMFQCIMYHIVFT